MAPLQNGFAAAVRFERIRTVIVSVAGDRGFRTEREKRRSGGFGAWNSRRSAGRFRRHGKGRRILSVSARAIDGHDQVRARFHGGRQVDSASRGSAARHDPP